MATLTGSELRRRREAIVKPDGKHLTMAEFGEALGGDGPPVHWNTVSRWERERMKMKHPEMVAAKLAELERLYRRRVKRAAGQVSLAVMG